nr:phage portal protein [Aerococcus urinae]
MTQSEFAAIDFASKDWIELLQKYINIYKTQQLPRLKELKRYYMGNNNIKYRAPKTDEYAPDNRIASDFARYITIFEQGYMLGKPIQYKNENKLLQEQIDDFNIQNNEEHHNVQMKTDLSIYGRSYELLTVEQDDGQSLRINLIKLNTEQTFVVYDDSYHDNSLYSVNFYNIDYGTGERKSFVTVCTADHIYYYEDDSKDANQGLHLVDEEEHYFKGVPVTEFNNNEDRTGAFESVLDNIDAYDLSQSELANFQQSSVDALLVISGNPYTGAGENDFNEDGTLNPNGRLAVSKAFKEAQMLILDNNPMENGVKPDAKYLVKQYDAEGAEKYKDRLVDDILRFTFTPDSNDDSFAGNRSGESMKYKLMASDNLRAEQERMFKTGIMRRLRLVSNIWSIRGNESTAYDLVNQTNIIFTPNVPKTNNEIVAMAQQLYGMVSNQTVYEMLSAVTGLDADVEIKRMEEINAEKRFDKVEVLGDGQEERKP